MRQSRPHFYPRSPCGERRRRSVKLFRQNYISIHALLAESDKNPRELLLRYQVFLSTLSLRRATPPRQRHGWQPRDFYPRSPCGERRKCPQCHRKLILFLSTLSLRRATQQRHRAAPTRPDFYPRSPCGERRIQPQAAVLVAAISIHALLAESDPLTSRAKTVTTISIHALLAESDPPIMIRQPTPTGFLSTLSLRRATAGMVWDNRHFKFLSTLSLRRATHGALPFGYAAIISIHALLAESDAAGLLPQ